MQHRRTLLGLVLVFLLLVTGVRAGQSTQSASSVGAADQDKDGYPDALELVGTDKFAFADWFAAIAEAQFAKKSADWRASEQDCAGLLRYAYWNALAKHTAHWYKKFSYLHLTQPNDVRAYHFPVPILGNAVFRVAPGSYQTNDVVAARFVPWASAQYLANFSSVRISRQLKDARRGDLLFFLRPGLASYHSMIYLGNGMVVYHTGGAVRAPANTGGGVHTPANTGGTGRTPANTGGGVHTPANTTNINTVNLNTAPGEVRLLSIDTLLHHPDSAFHPIAQNPNFLGVYRWKILQ